MKFKRRLTGAQKRAADFPLATIAAYGPTNQTATKIAVGIIEKPNGPVASMQRWFWNGTLDIRQDTKVADEVGQFIKLHQVKKTVISEKIMGCPHEEGIDYPDGEVCHNVHSGPVAIVSPQKPRRTGAPTASPEPDCLPNSPPKSSSRYAATNRKIDESPLVRYSES